MYNQSKCGCGCNREANAYDYDSTMNYGAGYGMQNPMCGVAPVMAPKKVCVSQSNRYVEQPVICPVECRHVQNLVYYPRYYPRYEQTYVTQDACGGYGAGGINTAAYGNKTAGYGNNTYDN